MGRPNVDFFVTLVFFKVGGDLQNLFPESPFQCIYIQISVYFVQTFFKTNLFIDISKIAVEEIETHIFSLGRIR